MYLMIRKFSSLLVSVFANVLIFQLLIQPYIYTLGKIEYDNFNTSFYILTISASLLNQVSFYCSNGNDLKAFLFITCKLCMFYIVSLLIFGEPILAILSFLLVDMIYYVIRFLKIDELSVPFVLFQSTLVFFLIKHTQPLNAYIYSQLITSLFFILFFLCFVYHKHKHKHKHKHINKYESNVSFKVVIIICLRFIEKYIDKVICLSLMSINYSLPIITLSGTITIVMNIMSKIIFTERDEINGLVSRLKLNRNLMLIILLLSLILSVTLVLILLHYMYTYKIDLTLIVYTTVFVVSRLLLSISGLCFNLKYEELRVDSFIIYKYILLCFMVLLFKYTQFQFELVIIILFFIFSLVSCIYDYKKSKFF